MWKELIFMNHEANINTSILLILVTQLMEHWLDLSIIKLLFLEKIISYQKVGTFHPTFLFQFLTSYSMAAAMYWVVATGLTEPHINCSEFENI